MVTEYMSGAPNNGFLLNTLKTLFRLSRVLLDLWKGILCALLHLFGHPRGTWEFLKLQKDQYYFPENFRCNLSFYESENFLIPALSITFLNLKPNMGSAEM